MVLVNGVSRLAVQPANEADVRLSRFKDEKMFTFYGKLKGTETTEEMQTYEKNQPQHAK